ncbi:hypothetical protein RM549_15920 [Salegentibacter sp. F188]|uniref:DUF3278 domain-containing protein n=1 Tax=Autumnicola patrickiae TaxID=3075591 RepID=A0ABU3E5K5_9FLAO|nr:hypothetical protein [Salegentibacter sp. F188]MDT0691283.1 hypothetical protein [Salegentibacter sp. F188]
MELEEMKNTWQEMSKRLENQEILTNQIIEKMTKEKYNSKFNTLHFYEIIGAVICYGSALFLIVSFHKLEEWYLMVFGVIALLSLLVLPVLALKKIGNMKKLDIGNNSYKDVLIKFQKSKIDLLFTQKIIFYISLVLAVIILPVTSKIFRNKDLFDSELINNLWIYIPVLLIFLFFLSRWVFKGYRSATSSAEDVLREMDK